MNSVKVEDILEGDSNFNPWNSRVLIISEENNLLKFVNEVPEPEEDAEKYQWKKNDAKAIRILCRRSFDASNLLEKYDQGKDCLIP